jgi:hypothetical protein
MSKQAQTFVAFAQSQATAGNFADIHAVRKHYSELHYKMWLDTTLNQYRNYLTESFPQMTLREAAELTAQE